LFDVITGRHIPDGGAVVLDGDDIHGRSPDALVRLGMARTFQECRVFPELTCLENVLFAVQSKSLTRTLRQAFTRAMPHTGSDEAEARRLLTLATLESYADVPAAALSFGQRRLLEIVAALMSRPRILLLDEPASGVNPGLLEILRTVLVAMQREHPALVLIVEHNTDFIMSLCDRIIVMHQGTVLEEGPPAAIQKSDRVIEAYLG
jgi:ABC-type branched-subunit amino acid transport system ATPase component